MVIDTHIYPCKVLVSYGDKSLVESILIGVVPDTELSEFMSSDSVGSTTLFSTGDVVLYLNKKPTSAYDYSKLVHEIYHCATYILNYVGIKHSRKSDEAFAYLVGFLTENIFEQLFICDNT